MSRDDIVTFGLAIVATVITYIVASVSSIESESMFLVSLAVFGVLLFGRSFIQSAY